ncbi:MAG: hypothetical protein M3133_09400, partial [Actinomycetota bacterium]|nr:hypothetical protein [Actinomycetota bacterium]
VDAAPDVIAATPEGEVWLLNQQAGAVTRMDADGNLSDPLRVGSRPSDIVVADEAVWVSDLEDGTLTKIDRSIVRIEKVIELDAPIAAVAVEEGTGALWALVY